MNIKDFSDLNEKLSSYENIETEFTSELIGFLVFALLIMIVGILFILLG